MASVEVEGGEDGEESDDEDKSDGEDEASEPCSRTFGSRTVVDGRLVVETNNFAETIQQYVSMLEAEEGASSDEDSDEGDGNED